jgi:hypothetical protein
MVMAVPKLYFHTIAIPESMAHALSALQGVHVSETYHGRKRSPRPAAPLKLSPELQATDAFVQKKSGLHLPPYYTKRSLSSAQTNFIHLCPRIWHHEHTVDNDQTNPYNPHIATNSTCPTQETTTAFSACTLHNPVRIKTHRQQMSDAHTNSLSSPHTPINKPAKRGVNTQSTKSRRHTLL